MRVVVEEVIGIPKPEKKNNYMVLIFEKDELIVEEKNWKLYHQYKIKLNNIITLNTFERLNPREKKKNFIFSIILISIISFLLSYVILNNNFQSSLLYGLFGGVVALFFCHMLRKKTRTINYREILLTIYYINDSNKIDKIIAISDLVNGNGKKIGPFKELLDNELEKVTRSSEILKLEKEIKGKQTLEQN